MKISQNLSQFVSRKALFVVLERKNGIFHYASDGKMVKVGSVKVELAPYSDREGFFVRGGGGKVYGSGMSYKDNKEYIKVKFIKKLHDTMETLVQKYDIKDLYIFAPRDTVPYILGGITGGVIKDAMIKNIFFGNMSNKPPLELIEMIRSYQEKITQATASKNKTKEAAKILKRAKKAKKVTG